MSCIYQVQAAAENFDLCVSEADSGAAWCACFQKSKCIYQPFLLCGGDVGKHAEALVEFEPRHKVTIAGEIHEAPKCTSKLCGVGDSIAGNFSRIPDLGVVPEDDDFYSNTTNSSIIAGPSDMPSPKKGWYNRTHAGLLQAGDAGKLAAGHSSGAHYHMQRLYNNAQGDAGDGKGANGGDVHTYGSY